MLTLAEELTNALKNIDDLKKKAEDDRKNSFLNSLSLDLRRPEYIEDHIIRRKDYIILEDCRLWSIDENIKLAIEALEPTFKVFHKRWTGLIIFKPEDYEKVNFLRKVWYNVM